MDICKALWKKRKMKIKGLVDECFGDYKMPAMYIAFPYCSFKCDLEIHKNYCQNSHLANSPSIEISKEEILHRYLSNDITEAIVLGGLEPFDSELELLAFIDCARRQFNIKDPIIIYTGYTEAELEDGNYGRGGNFKIQQEYWESIKNSGNIIVKFGRFRPNEQPHFDEVLGVYLANKEQYAKEYV